MRPGTADDSWPMPIAVELDVPAGTQPWVRFGSGGGGVACTVLVDGIDVTTPAGYSRPGVSNPGSLTECGAGREP